MKKTIAFLLSAVCAMALLCACNQPDSGNVEELGDLKGKVVYSIGQGNVPDLVFRAVLKKAGIKYELTDNPDADTVGLCYVADGAEFTTGFAADRYAYGVISEPAATVAEKNVEGAKRLFDIQKIYGGAGYPQAALVVKKAFLEAHPGYVAEFVAAFKEGAKWAESSPAEALAAIKSAGSTTVPLLTADVAKGCNLGFTSAASAKEELLGFYAALNSVKLEEETGVAKMPDDEFFKGDIEGAHEDGVTAKVYAPDGAPAISLAKMINDATPGTEYHIVPPAQIMQNVVQNADIAIMPTNAAAIRYGADKSVVMLGVTNYGSLYLLGK